LIPGEGRLRAALTIWAYSVRVRGLLLVLLGSLGVVSGAVGAARPAVWLTQASPVTVAGSGFSARVPVRVSYASGGSRWVRTLTTTRSGTFRASFGGVAFARCKGAVLTAAGAVVRVLPCAAPNGRPSVEGELGGAVRGTAFVPRERVSLTATVSGREPVRATTTASEAGAFALRMQLPHARCAEVFYSARGALGSSATFVTPAPDCKEP
jgi:hypothetical protein